MGGERQAGPDRVPGVVDGEDGRARGRRVPDVRVRHRVRERLGESERCVHQLLESQDEDPGGPVSQPVRDGLGHPPEVLLQPRPVGGQEAVPSPVGEPGRPVQVDPRHREHRRGRGARPGGGRRSVGLRGGGKVGDEPLPRLQDVVGELDPAFREGHRLDAGAQPGRESVRPVPVGGASQVDQGREDVVAPRPDGVQGLDGVQHRPAGGELVVHQHRGHVAVERGGVGGQQQMARRVAVLLLEPAVRGESRDGTARGVQVVGVSEGVRDRVAEGRRGLRVAHDDGVHRPPWSAQQVAQPGRRSRNAPHGVDQQ